MEEISAIWRKCWAQPREFICHSKTAELSVITWNHSNNLEGRVIRTTITNKLLLYIIVPPELLVKRWAKSSITWSIFGVVTYGERLYDASTRNFSYRPDVMWSMTTTPFSLSQWYLAEEKSDNWHWLVPQASGEQCNLTDALHRTNSGIHILINRTTVLNCLDQILIWSDPMLIWVD